MVALVASKLSASSNVRLVTILKKVLNATKQPKAKAFLFMNRLSTGMTYQLIPKTAADGIAIALPVVTVVHLLKMEKFSGTCFNYPANYWDGASGAINHLLRY